MYAFGSLPSPEDPVLVSAGTMYCPCRLSFNRDGVNRMDRKDTDARVYLWKAIEHVEI